MLISVRDLSAFVFLPYELTVAQGKVRVRGFFLFLKSWKLKVFILMFEARQIAEFSFFGLSSAFSLSVSV